MKQRERVPGWLRFLQTITVKPLEIINHEAPGWSIASSDVQAFELNTREWAILIWLAVFLAWAFTKAGVRRAAGQRMTQMWAADPALLAMFARRLAYDAVTLAEEGQVTCGETLLKVAVRLDPTLEQQLQGTAPNAAATGNLGWDTSEQRRETGGTGHTPFQATQSDRQEAEGSGCGPVILCTFVGLVFFNIPGAIIGFIVGVILVSKE